MSIHSAPVLKAYQKASILMVCAHRWESLPFIDRQSLSPVADHPFPFPLHSDSEGFFLLICGQGIVRAATATAAFLSHSDTHERSLVVANFGVAGSRPGGWPLGQPLMLHKVVEQASASTIFPERLLRHDWPESACFSVIRPADAHLERDLASPSACGGVENPVFDMEAFGVCAAGEQYLSTSQLVLGKFVSDHIDMTDTPCWKELTARIRPSYSEAALEFLRFVQSHHDHLRTESRRVKANHCSAWVTETVSGISSRIKITVSQTRALESRLRAHALAAPDQTTLHDLERDLWCLLHDVEPGPEKLQNKKTLKRLMERLLTPSIFESNDDIPQIKKNQET
jgi:hypothetical protein